MGLITASRTAPPAPRRPRQAVARRTANYLAASETHTFAFSIAAQALLSFFPFLVFLLALTRNVLHSPRLFRGLLTLIAAYLPIHDAPNLHDRRYILDTLRAIVVHHQQAQIFSLLILLAACAGMFIPLEVALNRIWSAPRNRAYGHAWAVALGLSFACGVLSLLSASLTALSESYSDRLANFIWKHSPVPLGALHHLVPYVTQVLVRAGAVPVTIGVFFLIYWRLPNAPVPAKVALEAAVVAGLGWEVSKYVYIALLPWLNFRDIYGPFSLSISLLLWAYVSALLVLAGAEVMAESRRLARPAGATL
ncbi:MAG: YihY/virulence factor BrkB family protein [Terriglobales bacterium]